MSSIDKTCSDERHEPVDDRLPAQVPVRAEADVHVLDDDQRPVRSEDLREVVLQVADPPVPAAQMKETVDRHGDPGTIQSP
eukprot:948804-Heterocapsa_arctica.AAC.1